MKILVTGGCGFIGSHTTVELLKNGYEVIVLDNLSNSNDKVAEKIKKITGRDIIFHQIDLCDKEALEEVFKKYDDISAVFHFAGNRIEDESLDEPLMYYRNNLDTTLTLLEVMKEFDCKKIIFASSSAVYGNPEKLPIPENSDLRVITPFGQTKLACENILRDIYATDDSWSIALLRYFNPAGGHESGMLGEKQCEKPNNLIPVIIKIAQGELDELKVFGDSYNTPDGTTIRDYVHVTDLAKAHIKTLEKVLSTKDIDVYNLGTGHGYSVLDVIRAFEKVNNIKIPYTVVDRKSDEVQEIYADITYAENKLGWHPEKSLEDMCKDAYNFAVQHKKEEEEEKEAEAKRLEEEKRKKEEEERIAEEKRLEEERLKEEQEELEEQEEFEEIETLDTE